MKNKIKYSISFIWNCIVAFTLPVCFSCIFLLVTGHSKGYDYELGSEESISAIVGLFALIIWLLLALPSGIYTLRMTIKKGKLYLLIPIVLYIALALICIAITGGWSSYLKTTFNI